MSLQIQPATMFLALVASTIAATVVLLWSYRLNRDEKSPVWMAAGYLLAAGATFLMSRRGALPDWSANDVGGALLLLGTGFLIVGARAFNRTPTPVWVPLIAPAVWLAACAMPAIYDSPDVRVTVLSLISAVLYFIAAIVFARRDGLATRLPLAIALAVHGVLVLLRIPFVLTDGVPGVAPDALWFGLATLEAVVFIQVTPLLMVSLAKERVENRLRAAAQTDELTGLANRRAFFERGEAAIAQALRSGAPLAVVVFDLDRFKDINDTHGHPTGDAVLQIFARAALERLRVSDFVARIGGEEFAALLPDTDSGRAALVALQINRNFEVAVAGMAHAGLAGTASAGVAGLSAGERRLADLMSAADRALYEAKAMGRGQVRTSEPKSEPAETGVRAA